MALTDTAIRNAKPTDKPYALTDECGLSIQIQPSGGKWWRFRFRFRFDGARVRQLLTQVHEFIRGCFKKCHYSKVSCSGNCGFVRLKAAKMLACSVLVVDSPVLG